mmetsp:Transcript_458/g.1011  ORF Transcript_458/g.1011 Transcript_458/m.1011 type:complete len:202 (-) Transcript_458:370-975(-)
MFWSMICCRISHLLSVTHDVGNDGLGCLHGLGVTNNDDLSLCIAILVFCPWLVLQEELSIRITLYLLDISSSPSDDGRGHGVGNVKNFLLQSHGRRRCLSCDHIINSLLGGLNVFCRCSIQDNLDMLLLLNSITHSHSHSSILCELSNVDPSSANQEREYALWNFKLNNALDTLQNHFLSPRHVFGASTDLNISLGAIVML